MAKDPKGGEEELRARFEREIDQDTGFAHDTTILPAGPLPPAQLPPHSRPFSKGTRTWSRSLVRLS
jgi:hypothetical protein